MKQVRIKRRIEDYFPYFHPLQGKREQVPVFVSVSQVNEIQRYFSENCITEQDILNTIDKNQIQLESSRVEISPLKINIRSYNKTRRLDHRSSTLLLGERIRGDLKDDYKNRAVMAGILVMLKLNNLLYKTKYTDDYQILDEIEKRKLDTIEIIEAADIGLAISDLFGEFSLAKNGINSELKRRQIEEIERKEKASNAGKSKGRTGRNRMIEIYNDSYRNSDLSVNRVASLIWEKMEQEQSANYSNSDSLRKALGKYIKSC